MIVSLNKKTFTKNHLNDWRSTIDLFEHQVNKTPDAVALIFQSESLTYKDLNAKANQLANHLLKKGATIGSFIIVSYYSDFAMIIAILACWKIGAVIIPIDPSHPIGRKKHIIEDAKASILLTQDCIKETFSGFSGEIIDLKNLKAVENEDEKNIKIKTGNDHTLYIIYTSGTTGKSKGVIGGNAGYINTICDSITRFSVNKNSRVLQFASLSFDVCLLEIGMTLLSGGKLILLDKRSLINDDQICNVLKDFKITHAILPPCILTKISDKNLSTLATLIVGGEICPSALAKWGERRNFFNVYGMTEVSIMSTTFQVKSDKHYENSIPIGQPISNTKIYVLDKKLKLVDYNQTGELYIGGIGITKGYLNMPDLTREKYIENPFCPGELIYKTGDLVKYDPEGDLQYVGRIDRQIKINDFRVDLYEIESALLECSKVTGAAVTVSEQESVPFLTAYVTLDKASQNVTVEDLNNFIKKILPNPVLPKHIYIIEKMPLTVNGKIDFKSITLKNGN